MAPAVRFELTTKRLTAAALPLSYAERGAPGERRRGGTRGARHRRNIARHAPARCGSPILDTRGYLGDRPRSDRRGGRRGGPGDPPAGRDRVGQLCPDRLAGPLVPSLIRSVKADFAQTDGGIGLFFFVGAVFYACGCSAVVSSPNASGDGPCYRSPRCSSGWASRSRRPPRRDHLPYRGRPPASAPASSMEA